MTIEKFIEDNLDEQYITEEDLDEITTDDINLKTDSVDEIADAIQNTIEDASDDKATVSDAKADKLAQDAKKAADDINAKNLAIIGKTFATENLLTKKLDRCLADSKTFMRRGEKVGSNLLVESLPGSGKTATVYDWAKRRGVNVCYVNAKDNDLQAFLNGFPVRDDENRRAVVQAYASEGTLKELEKENSILFLDEYNRQIHPEIRAALLTLINEKYVSGPDEGGRHYFKNLLFTVACINPAVPTDPGAAELNQAELSRFARLLKGFDSTPQNAQDYFHKHFSEMVARAAMNQKDKKDPEYLADLEDWLRCEDLGLYITSDPKFYFDGVGLPKAALYDILNDARDDGRLLLNQRMLTDGLEVNHGDINDFIDWATYDANMLDETRDMILKIANNYLQDVPSFKDLVAGKQKEFDKLGLSIKILDDVDNVVTDTSTQADAETEENDNTVTDTHAEDDNLLDDDETLFSQQVNSNTATTAKSNADKLKTFLDTLGI